MSRHFYLMDMDQQSHHANVRKYKRNRESFTKLSVCVEVFDCSVVWVLLEKAENRERAHVSHKTLTNYV